MTELKKCPHCGGEAEIRITEWDNSSKTHYSVMCQKCESETTLYKTEAEAKAAWSKRDGLSMDEIRVVLNNFESSSYCKSTSCKEFICLSSCLNCLMQEFEKVLNRENEF